MAANGGPENKEGVQPIDPSKGLEIENKDFVGVAKEVSESMEEAKTAYKKMEEINARLEEKLVVLNRIGKVT